MWGKGMKEFTTFRKIDDSTIEITTYTQHKFGTSAKISYGKIAAVVLTVIFCSVTFFFATYKDTSEIETTYQEDYSAVLDENDDRFIPFSSDGFVFPESSTQYITSDDLDNLAMISVESDYTYQELLRFSVNEIYARHGYQFIPGGSFDVFYSQYQWYTESIKVDVTWDLFNDYEQHNLNLLLNEESRNGFRH